MRRKKDYALYEGDNFIDLGTIEYLADIIDVEPKTIAWYSRTRNTRKHKYIVIPID